MSTDRAGYIAGLRAFAAALEAHEEIPLPYPGSTSGLTISFLTSGREAMAAAARALPCNWQKKTWEADSGNAYFELNGALEGLEIQLTAYRDAVCTRVVTGTRKVTKTVKDPDALAAVPEVEVTETVEDVEWECGPLLSGGTE